MHQLTVQDLNPAVLNVQYAVRGELAIKAEDLRTKLEAGHDLPFKRVINSNIGNPQQKGLDQPPLTFTRQVCQLSAMRDRRRIVIGWYGGSGDPLACAVFPMARVFAPSRGLRS